MKKIPVLFALISGLLLTGQSFKYGLTGNFHRGSVAGVHDRSVGRYGFGLGFFGQWSLVENDIFDSAWLYLTPQIEYSTQGENAVAEKEKFGTQKFHQDYITAQVFIKYFMHKGNMKRDVFFFGGPRVSFLVNDKREVDPAYDAIYYKYNQDSTVSKTNIGVSLGAGIRVSQEAEAFIRWDQGFVNVYPENTRRNTLTRQLSVGVNYYIRKNWW